MTKARQHNAHVLARAKLIRRIVERMMEWGLPGKDKRPIEVIAAERLANYGWGHSLRPEYRLEWTIKRAGAYPNQKVVGQFADVPTSVIHAIMCGSGAVKGGPSGRT